MTQQNAAPQSPHDTVVLRLQDLRRSAGEPSYAQIARQVAELRVSRGVPEHAALPPRTTVYDAFRLGRRRLDQELVADLTEVLTRAVEERRELITGMSVPAFALVPLERAVEEASPLAAGGPAPEEVRPGAGPHAGSEADSTFVESHVESHDAASVGSPSWRAIAVVLVVCLVLNSVGLELVQWLGQPIYLDMVGTVVAAVALGPWWGAGVALASAGLYDVTSDSHMLWFWPVAVLGALMWGYGARRFGMARSIAGFMHLSLWVSLFCTLASLPPLYFVLDRWLSHPTDAPTLVLVEHLPFPLAVLVSNGLFVFIDKLLTAFIALAILDALKGRWTWVRSLVEAPRD